MIRACLIGLYLFGTLLISGCTDHYTIENVTLSLLIGIDINENNNLVFSVSSPVFNKEAKTNEEEFEVTASTLRRSREEFDKLALGSTSAGKTQILLIGKRLAQQGNWEALLDPFYRDTKSTVTARIALVEGPVSDVLHFAPNNKPRLPLHLSNLIDTAVFRNETTKTNLQEFHRQLKEKGITPSMTVLRKEKDIIILGTALLDKHARYLFTIDSDETKLMYILKHQTSREFPFTLKMPMDEPSGIIDLNHLSFNTEGLKVKTDGKYANGKFVFDVEVNTGVYLMERLFPFDVRKETKNLEKDIAQQLQQKFERLIRKLQNAKIDPAGFGMYARAYAYPQWLKVSDNWGEAFKDAEVNVKVNVKIIGMGAVK